MISWSYQPFTAMDKQNNSCYKYVENINLHRLLTSIFQNATIYFTSMIQMSTNEGGRINYIIYNLQNTIFMIQANDCLVIFGRRQGSGEEEQSNCCYCYCRFDINLTHDIIFLVLNYMFIFRAQLNCLAMTDIFGEDKLERNVQCLSSLST